MPRADSQYGIFCQAVFAVHPHAAADDGITTARNGGFDFTGTQRQAALHDGKIAFLGTVSQKWCGKSVLRTKDQTTGVFVDAVDRAKYTNPALLLQIIQPAIGKRAVRVIQGGMYSDTGGLFQHSGKLVLVRNSKRDRLRRNTGRRLRRQSKGNLLAGMHGPIGMEGGSIGKEAIAIVFNGFDQTGGDTLRAQEDPQPLTVR